MATEVFLNSAKLVDETGKFTCEAIYVRMGHGFSQAAQRYRLMFDPQPADWYRHGARPNGSWWNGPDTPDHRTARVFALLLAHEMAQTGDL